MAEVLNAFGTAFSASLFVAAPAAIAWGVLSVALSPCHLSSVPLVVAYMGGGPELPSGRRALAISSSFAAGILVSIAAIGALTAAAGRMLGDVGRAGTFILAALFLVFGLNLLGWMPLPSFSPRKAAPSRRGAGGAFLLGLVFGAALGPCTFAFMAPLLGLVLYGGRSHPAAGALLVALFGLGHAAAIALAGASIESVQRWLASRGGARAVRALRLGAGGLVLGGGAYFVYTAF